ncbi:Alpha/Beta hydrolase protein [Aspergillus leporis]|jgi:pimeloyl-ACP methyl ester carboxylesterase|uniref:Alpha/Beta hydrolase protein n=1 Tax=Aspergillus leporis TaxID=41062 RepID=A0A5N5XC55_9EURO|nr:Alpha/Beta hydrolase protein [Aspergillus leporis]
MLFLTILLGLTAPSLAAVRAAANLNVSAATLETYGCDATCQAVFNYAQTKDRELFGTDFEFGFYATASNFSGSQPGDLLKFEAINPEDLNVITGMSAYRFQYTSRDPNGSLVPATGFIGIPYTTFRKDKKYPVIAYAHGTIGVFAGCAPSTTPTLYDYTSWSLLMGKGYAIVAPDYAGLGNNYTPHKYLSFPAHANDLYYSMIAARKVFPGLFTNEWMSVGHSQGGGAVWKLSESKMLQTGAAGKYIGTVALAPASKIYDMTLLGIEKLTQTPDYASYDILYETLWLPFAIERAIPNMDRAPFAETLQNRTKIATIAQACNYAIMSLAYGLEPSALFTPAILNNTDFQKWQDMVAPANGGKAGEPMMVIQGLNDTAVLPQITIKSYRDTCRYGNEAHLRLYPGMDHSDVLTASSPEWLAFISNRFTGENTTGRCSTITHKPFDAAHMVTSSEADEMISI